MAKVTFKRKDKRTNLEQEIDNILLDLNNLEAGTDEYEEASKHLERLYKLKAIDKKDRKQIDPNVIVSTLGSIACILLIASFEQDGIFPTKCFPFIPKGRA